MTDQEFQRHVSPSSDTLGRGNGSLRILVNCSHFSQDAAPKLLGLEGGGGHSLAVIQEKTKRVGNIILRKNNVFTR